MKRKIEYLVSILISLALLEIGLFGAWGWFWSGFPWSPFGYETCGLEVLVFLFIVWPAFILAELIRLGLLIRWKFPAYMWYLPLILCGFVSIPLYKDLTMGIYCAAVMLLLPFIDMMAFRKAERKERISQ